MKITASYGECRILVIGVDMNCPLCGTLVFSGTQHQCTLEPKIVTAPKKRKKKVKP